MPDTHVTNFPNVSKGGYKLFAFKVCLFSGSFYFITSLQNNS